MINNLKLITTERFGDLDCNFYQNMNDNILLTREQIGTALEYVYPDDALSKIHKRHKDRLDTLSEIAKLASADGKEYETRLYTQKGVMEICRWSNKPKANQFMDWVWDIVERYRNGETNNTLNLQPLLDTLTVLTQSITTMQQDISTLKEQQESIQKCLPKKKFSAWASKMFPKYQCLMDYFGIERKKLYHNLFIEFQNTYPDIDLNQEQDDYCFQNGLESCFTMDAIEHNKELRILFTAMVDSLLEKYNIASQSNRPLRQTTIFDD